MFPAHYSLGQADQFKLKLQIFMKEPKMRVTRRFVNLQIKKKSCWRLLHCLLCGFQT